jgi:hypothetical protein
LLMVTPKFTTPPLHEPGYAAAHWRRAFWGFSDDLIRFDLPPSLSQYRTS